MALYEHEAKIQVARLKDVPSGDESDAANTLVNNAAARLHDGAVHYTYPSQCICLNSEIDLVRKDESILVVIAL